MSHLLRCLGIAVLAIGVLGAQPASAAHAPTLVADPSGLQLRPRTDGQTVIWLDYRAGDLGNAELYGARLSDAQVFPIETAARALASADIDAGVVVWAAAATDGSARDIRGVRLATGERFAVTDSPNEDDVQAAISGRWVVWIGVDAAGQATLMARDIVTMGAPVEIAPIAATGRGPAISGDRVVWEDLGAGDNGALYTTRVGAGVPALVAALPAGPSNAGGSFGYDVAGDTVVYVNGAFRLVAADVVTGATTSVDIGAYSQQPTTDGRYVVWEDRGSFQGSEGRRVDLRGYDLRTGSAFVVASGPEQRLSPELRAGTLVWSSGTDTQTAIDAAPFSDLLPSARRPDPGAADPAWRYFSETGHYLSWGFKGYWDANGGLPVFGYPLTEEFSEQNPDTGAPYTVQYLERQRFEWHPENAGTPYETLLGRLGAQDAAARGLLGSSPFSPATPGGGQDCAFFAETGHNVCGGFLAYWRERGLEFGDTGVSFRESLALFGYPISEEFVDPASGLRVQYFERAVFEYHPENAGTANEVLLRRLGADILAARGW